MSSKQRVARCVVLAGLCGAATGIGAAQAANPEADAAGQQALEPVVVTAVAPESALTFVTDPKLPRQPVPASDGADFLKTIAGFSAIRNGGSNGDPVLRGMFGSRLNLLTNDGSMPGACPARMDNPLSYVAPDTYDRLTVIKGPQTVQWGPGASAGTVRFERDVERFEEPGLRADADVLGGSFGRNDQVLDFLAGMPQGYVRLTANRSEAGDYENGAGETVPSLWKKWNADATFGWTPGENTLLELSTGGGDGQARYAGRGMDGAKFERASHAMRFEQRELPGVLDELAVSLFHNTAHHVMDNYSLREPNPMGAMPMPMASSVQRRTHGGRIAAVWRTALIEWTLGADAQDSRHQRRSAMGRDAWRALPWSADAAFSNTGLFTEATWHAGNHRHVIAGARVDRASVTDRRQAGARTRHEDLGSGFLRFEQEVRGGPLSWYAGVGHSQRMPDYWELFSAGTMGAVDAFASVKPERTTQLDIGARWHSADLDVWVSAYAGRIEDYILFTYTAGGMMGPSARVSNAPAAIRGGEAGIEYRLRQRWSFGGTLAHAWGENRATGGALPQMPPLEARLSLGYQGPRASLGLLLRAVDRQDRVAPGQGNVVGRDLAPTGSFAVFSLNGGYRVSARMRIAAGIDNLFDHNYSEHLNLAGNADFGYPADPQRIGEPGRNGWIRLDYSHHGL